MVGRNPKPATKASVVATNQAFATTVYMASQQPIPTSSGGGGGTGDMTAAVYDPNSVAADAFDYNNFINTPTLAAVATSGAYSDLTGTPTIPAAADRFAYERSGTGFFPASTDFTATSSTGLTTSNDAYGMTFTKTGSLAVLYKSLPASQKFDMIARISGFTIVNNFPGVGLAVMASSSGRLILFSQDYRTINSLFVSKFNNTGSFSANYYTASQTPYWNWFKVSCDGTSLSWYVGQDGNTWLLVGTQTLADFVTSVTLGGIALTGGGTYGVIGRVHHFEIVDNT